MGSDIFYWMFQFINWLLQHKVFLYGILLLFSYFVYRYFYIFILFTLIYSSRNILISLGKFVLFKFGYLKSEKVQDKPFIKKRCCVIGAGSSGITAIKNLIEDGHEVFCYEKSDTIGGNWAYNEKTGHSSVYETVEINSTKEIMCFSDFPLPYNLPYFINHWEVMKYFKSYVKHFNLEQYINFNTTVVSVQKQDKKWKVETSSEKGKQEELFDAVLVCNGHHWNPHIPSIEGEEEFKKNGGKIIHSHDYKSVKGFENKKILIVGTGNSGCDISVEVSNVSNDVILLSRSGVLVLPKYMLGIPIDHLFVTRFAENLPVVVKIILLNIIVTIFQGTMSKFGLDQAFTRSHPTVNQHLLNKIHNGKIKVQRGIIKKLDGEGYAYFEDGSKSQVDIIILSTGYSISFPFLNSENISVNDNKFDLYKYVVPVNQEGIYTIGFVQPLGAIMPIAEMQSRWVSRIIGEVTSLPSKEEMMKDIESKKSQMRSYYESRRHTIQVDHTEYMDEIAELIGCNPIVHEHPEIFFELMFGPLTTVQYRLDGPNKWKDAVKVIKEMNKIKPTYKPK